MRPHQNPGAEVTEQRRYTNEARRQASYEGRDEHDHYVIEKVGF